MTRGARATLGLLALGLLGAAGWWWQRPMPRAIDPPATTIAPPSKALEFNAGEVIRLAPTKLVRSIPVTGSVNATAQTLVKSRVSGDIQTINVREGMAVKVGEVIAIIDPTDFQLRVAEREAALRSAEAQLEQARRTLANNQALLEKNFISQNAFDNARWGVEVAAAARDSADSLLAQARKALSDSRIAAPMSGLIAQRFVQPGEKVSPDNRIVSIVDLSAMEVELPIPAGEAGAIRIGQTTKLQIEGIAEPFVGRVLRINPATQSGTRSVPIYLSLDRADIRLRAGLFVQGLLALETRDNVIAVPPAAVRDQAGRRFVYVLEKDAVAEREVRLGLVDESAQTGAYRSGLVEVVSGLAAGDIIIAVNVGALRPGTPVRLAPQR